MFTKFFNRYGIFYLSIELIISWQLYVFRSNIFSFFACLRVMTGTKTQVISAKRIALITVISVSTAAILAGIALTVYFIWVKGMTAFACVETPVKLHVVKAAIK